MSVCGDNLSRRVGESPSMELLAMRKLGRQAADRYPRHEGVSIEQRIIADVDCLVLTPAEPRCQMLYFHGGGFRIGNPEISAGFLSHLAAATDCRIVAPFYSLAPRHPFPCALLDGRDVMVAMQAATDETAALPCLLGGDSAGGNLAAVLSRWFADSLCGALLLSPWLDLRVQAASYEFNQQRDSLFSRDAAASASALYLQGEPADGEDVSPLLADLSAMPETFIAVGTTEVLLDDALDFARKLAVSGRACELHVVPGMAHVEPTIRPGTDNTLMVLEWSAAFVRRCSSVAISVKEDSVDANAV